MDKMCFPINLVLPIEEDDINEIYALVNKIIKKCSTKDYKIINLEEL